MKSLLALVALMAGSAALAQTPPPAAAEPAAPVAKKVVVHQRSHVRTVTRKPSKNGVSHTNVVKSTTVKTPHGVATRTTTRSTTTPAQ